MNVLKNTAYILTLIGALNWGLIGIFGFNLVAAIFGDMTVLTRIVYALVGLSAIVTSLTIHRCEKIEIEEKCEYGNCSF